MLPPKAVHEFPVTIPTEQIESALKLLHAFVSFIYQRQCFMTIPFQLLLVA